MSGQLSVSSRFLREAVTEIAYRVIAESQFGMIGDSDSQLVAHKAKKYIKREGSMSKIMMIIWGTQLSPWTLFDGDFYGDADKWLTIWGVQNEQITDGHRRLLYYSESYKQYVRLNAYLILCAEVMMLMAHQDQLFSDDEELSSWKALYNDNHEFEDAA
jgi:hypothetical protein